MANDLCELFFDCPTLKTMNMYSNFSKESIIGFADKYCTKSIEDCSVEEKNQKVGYENCPMYIDSVVGYNNS